MKTFLREIGIIVLLGVIICFLIQATIQRFTVIGLCMEPGFHDEQQLLVNKVVYHLHEPERGDVIILHPPGDMEGPFIKRIIALPGDTVEVKEGIVYVSGSPLEEPYIKEPPRYTFQQYIIPPDTYFVLGDNRNNANDSHTGWVLPRQNIVGKVWLSIWPPSKWGLIPTYPLEEQITKPMSKELSLLGETEEA